MPQAFINKVPESFIHILQEYAKDLNLSFTIKEMCSQVVEHHNQLIRDHGTIDGTKRFNTLRVYIIKLLEGLEPDCPDFFAISEIHRFPSKLYMMVGLYQYAKDGCRISDRIIRSLLYLNRLAKGNNEIDLAEITKRFDLDISTIQEFRSHVRSWKKSSGFPETRSVDLIAEPLTRIMRGGPNGSFKWMTADIEALALTKTDLYIPFKTLCNLTGNQNLLSYMESIAKTIEKPLKRVKLRYITAITDNGNKSRLVAISDYWTQVLLNPLMRDVQNIIHQYFRFNCSIKSHNKGFLSLKRYINPNIVSYDISSWTDAFPAQLQRIVLEELYNPELAKAWSELVVECEWIVKGHNSLVKYGRGQGMGTSGSFDIATLTDLLVLDMIYNKYYKIKPTPSTYNKVGDDLWCHDPKGLIKDYYTKKLGIEINESKTKTATVKNLVGEFVSRNINFGTEVSRISANICRAFEKNPLDLTQLAVHLVERGIDLILPLNKLFEKKYRKDDLIRTFYVQSKVLGHLPAYLKASRMILKSLNFHFKDFILSDPVLSSLSPRNLERLKNGFLVYSISQQLHKIHEKVQVTLDTTQLEYECGVDLVNKNSKEYSFKYDGSTEPLNVRTSKFILAKTHSVIREIGRINLAPVRPIMETKPTGLPVIVTTHKGGTQAPPTLDISKLVDILDHLNSIVDGLTFKELGVISEEIPYRPKTTQIYNLVRSLRVREYHFDISDLQFGFEDDVELYSTLSLAHKATMNYDVNEIINVIEQNATITFTKSKE
jgi:hypothetical protein